MTRKLRPVAADAGRTLAAYLAERLGDAEIAEKITAGSVFVDNRRVRVIDDECQAFRSVGHPAPRERDGDIFALTGVAPRNFAVMRECG